MMPYVDDLISHSYLMPSQILPLDGPTCRAAGAMAWDHRDPFDRLIAVTALGKSLPIISADKHFDDIVTRIW